MKTYLSMLWLAAAPPHDVAYPARAWATLLDLPDPSGKGARRVNDAISWLEENNFVTVAAQAGLPNRVTLLNELGTGKRYRVPGEVFNKARTKGADLASLAGDRYVQVPPTFWTSGWMATLSAAGTAMFLVLLAEQVGKRDDQELWFSPEVANLRYSLSHDTRSAGLQELRRAGLVTAKRRPVASDVFDVQRFRNVYILHMDALTTTAAVPDKDELARPRKVALRGKSKKLKGLSAP
ncbi:hypothetical protein [Nocardioides bizhenqiangii]|uniref:Helix-turn-helix domain-containing protein n=1 Tax=Nocardioides bizhenqiangii TaxID=3095076 RepID=A0ABZ0ZTT6_9ACTN|nr:hypothetical protein [Nocardioides sp. HM61]WQQ27274.1 hypothetical protein SHK19_03370 [Nocardioides sp. HM61]